MARVCIADLYVMQKNSILTFNIRINLKGGMSMKYLWAAIIGILALFALKLQRPHAVQENPQIVQATSPLHDQIEGAILGATLGDALGRVTEFIPDTQSITKKYGPQGITSFKDFHANDWVTTSGLKIAAYTDDTVMSKILLEEALKTSKSPELFINALAEQYIQLFGPNKYSIDPLYSVRAHGPTNIQAGQALAKLAHNKNQSGWWKRTSKPFDNVYNAAISKEGGCGSVMRAWPLGIVYTHNDELLRKFADEQSQLTHRHPMARAASVALAAGVAEIIKNKNTSPAAVVDRMIREAEHYDASETLYKSNAHKVKNNMFSPHLVAEDTLLTSEMIRYAAFAAHSGMKPAVVFGTQNNKGHNHRSVTGALLGWAADEAVAAAVYVFLRHPDDLHAALVEAVNTPGDSDSIATLAGALVGARTGWQAFAAKGFDYSRLENVKQLKTLAYDTYLATKN